ncbi:YukJ family protein [Kitasatospora sp. NPDC088779]|uniref:YukJ family protein n=1 Tax=Kitasatospora sp. NPDC088779 TaxID=3154964 RepID=UPI0034165D26
MPISDYGVLAATAVDRRREGATDTPHYQIHLRDAGGTDYRAAVNVLSQQAPADLRYLAVEDFRHPVTGLLPPAGSGWNPLPSRPGTASLDFVRGCLFDPAAMRVLPPDLPGPDNDLADVLDQHVQRAIADPAAAVYVFGQRFGPEPGVPDKVFGFLSGNGVHDVHMNQGNSGRFRTDDGVYQDGALLIHLPAESRWAAVFLAFQSQSWHTDDRTGHALPASVPHPTRPRTGPRQATGPQQ